MKNLKFATTVATQKGYDNTNSTLLSYEEFKPRYDKLVEEIEKKTSIYLSAVVTEARAFYKHEWGCPDGGEKVYHITGNKFATASSEKFREAVAMLVEALKVEFEQSSVYAEIVEVELI